jgi:hypothetical protein
MRDVFKIVTDDYCDNVLDDYLDVVLDRYGYDAADKPACRYRVHLQTRC